MFKKKMEKVLESHGISKLKRKKVKSVKGNPWYSAILYKFFHLRVFSDFNTHCPKGSL